LIDVVGANEVIWEEIRSNAISHEQTGAKLNLLKWDFFSTTCETKLWWAREGDCYTCIYSLYGPIYV